jgi:hypothetical protein
LINGAPATSQPLTAFGFPWTIKKA